VGLVCLSVHLYGTFVQHALSCAVDNVLTFRYPCCFHEGCHLVTPMGLFCLDVAVIAALICCSMCWYLYVRGFGWHAIFILGLSAVQSCGLKSTASIGCVLNVG
jgi:hypothetical protein